MRSPLTARSNRQKTASSLFLDLGKGHARVGGREVRLTAKELLMVAALHERGGDLCSKGDLAKRVWPEFDGIVDDESIEQVISRLRRKIEPDPQHPRFLLTSRGLGYRLLASAVSEEQSFTRPSVRRPALFALAAIAIVVTGVAVLLSTAGGSRSDVPSAPLEDHGWTLLAANDFSDPDGTGLPKGAGSTLAGLLFTRGPEAGEYLMRVMKASGGSGLTSSGTPTSLESFAFEADARATGPLQYGLALFWGSADALQLRVDPVTGDVELFNTPEGMLAKVERFSAVRLASETNHLRFEVDGSRVSALINGAVVTSVTLASAARRPVSPAFHIFVLPGQEVVETSGTRAIFDNFRLFEQR